MKKKYIKKYQTVIIDPEDLHTFLMKYGLSKTGANKAVKTFIKLPVDKRTQRQERMWEWKCYFLGDEELKSELEADANISWILRHIVTEKDHLNIFRSLILRYGSCRVKSVSVRRQGFELTDEQILSVIFKIMDEGYGFVCEPPLGARSRGVPVWVIDKQVALDVLDAENPQFKKSSEKFVDGQWRYENQPVVWPHGKFALAVNEAGVPYWDRVDIVKELPESKMLRLRRTMKARISHRDEPIERQEVDDFKRANVLEKTDIGPLIWKPVPNAIRRCHVEVKLLPTALDQKKYGPTIAFTAKRNEHLGAKAMQYDSIYASVLVISDPMNLYNEGRVFLYPLCSTLLEVISSTNFDPYHFFESKILEIIIDFSGEMPNYRMSRFTRPFDDVEDNELLDLWSLQRNFDVMKRPSENYDWEVNRNPSSIKIAKKLNSNVSKPDLIYRDFRNEEILEVPKLLEVAGRCRNLTDRELNLLSAVTNHADDSDDQNVVNYDHLNLALLESFSNPTGVEFIELDGLRTILNNIR